MRSLHILLFTGFIAGTIGTATAYQITLDPGSLPSSQGWDYSAVGLHAGTSETDIFSTDGSALKMNSMGQSINWLTGGGILYRQNGAVSTSLPNTLEWTSRWLDYEYVPCTGQNHGFSIGFSDGSLRYGAGISLNNIALFDGSGIKNIAFDTSMYHTYRIETVTGSTAYDFYVDNVLQASASARYLNEDNRVYFGDGTGGANANVDITALKFSQIPEPGTTSLMALFAGGAFFVRRGFTA